MNSNQVTENGTTAVLDRPPTFNHLSRLGGDQLSSITTSRDKQCGRKGKVARLPKANRDMINRMIDDGLPYHIIIDELGEAGEGLNTQNITNWKQGGYQDYLKIQATIEKIKAQTEAATEILQGVQGIDTSKIMDACRQVAAVQLMEALMEQGDDAIRKAIAKEPARYFTLLNSICVLADSGLRYDKYRREIEIAGK